MVTCDRLCVPSLGCACLAPPEPRQWAHRPGWQDPGDLRCPGDQDATLWGQMPPGWPGPQPICVLASRPPTCRPTTGSHHGRQGPCRARRQHLWWEQETSVRWGGARRGPLVEGRVRSLRRQVGRRRLATQMGPLDERPGGPRTRGGGARSLMCPSLSSRLCRGPEGQEEQAPPTSVTSGTQTTPKGAPWCLQQEPGTRGRRRPWMETGPQPPPPETVPTEEAALTVPLTGDLLIVIFATVWIFLLGFMGGRGYFFLENL